MNKKIVLIPTLILIVSLIVLPIVLSAGAETYWWDLEQSPLAKAGNVNLGTYGTVTYPAGKIDSYSAETDGVSPNHLRNSTFSTDAQTAISAAYWVYVDDYSTATFNLFISRSGGGNFVLVVRVLPSPSRMYLNAYDGGDNDVQTAGTGTNVWVHVAVVAENGEKAKIWINGTLAESAATIGTLQTPDGNIVIGKEEGADGSYHDGKIDDLRIWYGYALTQGDVDLLYNNHNGRSGSLASDETPPTPADNGVCKSCPNDDTYDLYWNTDDTTTTIEFDTNEDATCAVMGNESGLANYNYTDMVANGGVNCATTGSIQQVCTIQSSNAFTIGEHKHIYAGCKDTESNEALNATLSHKIGVYTFGQECSLNCIKATSGCGFYIESGCTTTR